MLQLIFHGIGDFIVQNHWMATNKKKKGWKGFWACQIHCITYALPFKCIGSWLAVLVIYLTHFIVDRTRIVDYFLAWKNGAIKIDLLEFYGFRYSMFEIRWDIYDISNYGFKKDVPYGIALFCYIACDNVIHIICNYLSLKYL